MYISYRIILHTPIYINEIFLLTVAFLCVGSARRPRS